MGADKTMDEFRLEQFKNALAGIETKEKKSRKDIYLMDIFKADIKKLEERINRSKVHGL